MPESNQGSNPDNKSGLPWWHHIVYNRIMDLWNMTPFGKRQLMSQITKEGKPAPSEIMKRVQDLVTMNDSLIGQLEKIESSWEFIEEHLYGKKFKFQKDSFNEHVYSDVFRKISYFKDPEFTNQEAKIFQTVGTVRVSSMPGAKIDNLRLKQKAEESKKEFQNKIKVLESKPQLTEDEENSLNSSREGLQHTEAFLANTDFYVSNISILPKIEVDDHISPFLDGRKEKVVAIGPSNFKSISATFNSLQTTVDHFASSSGFGANVRTPVNQLFTSIQSSLKKISEEIEPKHGLEVGAIQKLLIQMESVASDTGPVGEKRPWQDFIRFLHTYKIIKPFKVKKIPDPATGKEKIEIIKFKEVYPKFKKDDEAEAGEDENGMPLEVFEYPAHSHNYYVLLDKWWAELSDNKWHENTIKDKPGGKEMWESKITKGVDKKGGYGVPYNKVSDVSLRRVCYVRKVPDPEFVDDLDPLERVSFISNEWDVFRDDFRDGRYHPNSKSSMDYILAEVDGITPAKPINFKIRTTDLKTRIRFIPVYYTKANRVAKELLGTVNPKGGLGVITTDDIPEDERLVSRRYEMKINVPDAKPDNEGKVKEKKLENRVRKPRHLNPAFDRAALGHEFIHWGRMLYYETPDGIERWSENPFPHIATRGFSKYLINLVLNNTYSFEEARNQLRGHKWDYGVRHYGKPYTLDPLGPADSPEGSLSHSIANIPKEDNG